MHNQADSTSCMSLLVYEMKTCLIMIIIIKTSSTGPSRKKKIVSKLLSQPHKHLRHRKLNNTTDGATDWLQFVKHACTEVPFIIWFMWAGVTLLVLSCWHWQCYGNSKLGGEVIWVPENVTFQESSCRVEIWMNGRN